MFKYDYNIFGDKNLTDKSKKEYEDFFKNDFSEFFKEFGTIFEKDSKSISKEISDLVNKIPVPEYKNEKSEKCDSSDGTYRSDNQEETNKVENETSKNKSFPFTNIYLDNEDNMCIQIVLPYYIKSEISIEKKDNSLIISGNRTDEYTDVKKYILNEFGDGFDTFELPIKLSEKYYNGKINADFYNYVLNIVIEPKEDTFEKITIK